MQVIEGEVGSPVDMAKSYMRTRPPWASPTVTPTEYRSPSPTGIQLFKEETPYSTGYTSLTSSKVFLLLFIFIFHVSLVVSFFIFRVSLVSFL